MLLYTKLILTFWGLFYFQSNDSGLGVFACCGGVLVLVVIVVAVNESAARRRAKELKEARDAYQTSLAQLKRNPTNANCRQRTLQLGRVYSNLTRNKKGVTIFDEIALMNDINAACAGATTVDSPPKTTYEQPRQPIEERLARLAELKTKGLIDETEYNARRQKILDEV